MRQSFSLFRIGFGAGLVSLGFNFLLRLGGLAAFPPESALYAFLRIVPASIEEPMVQEFGDFAGMLGLLVATVVAAAVYGLALVVFDKYAAGSIRRRLHNSFERLLALSFLLWIFFGLVLFPVDGDSLFGTGPALAYSGEVWAFPFSLLLVQGVFALVLLIGHNVSVPLDANALPLKRVPDVSRRTFIEKGTIGVLAVIAGIAALASLGELIFSRAPLTGGSQPVNLQAAPAIFRDPRLATLVESEITPNANFYRVAIDIVDPAVDPSVWSLKVDGLVNSPKSFSLQEVQSFPEVLQFATFECVSNEVNGNLISNAKWGGVKVADIISSAGGAGPGAQYVVFYSVDGYTAGIPLSRALKEDSILAYEMNGQPLPTSHGYPLRGVIPGLYGMMSAKWVTRVSVVGSVYQGYWQTRGWTNDGTVHTSAFLLIPEGGQSSLSANGGSVLLAGYAFAGDRGISKVELSFDNGTTWMQAQLKQPVSNLAWTLWAYDWRPESTGSYPLLVRATDATGQVQTSTVAGTFPNGATGYVSAEVNVVS